MNFKEKLKRATEGKKRSDLARRANLNPKVISNYINRKSTIPRADIAAKIAKALDVTVEWLFDDAQGWPPPQPVTVTPASFSDQELMRELAIRWRNALLDFISAADAAEEFDWQRATREVQRTPPGKPLPDY